MRASWPRMWTRRRRSSPEDSRPGRRLRRRWGRTVAVIVTARARRSREGISRLGSTRTRRRSTSSSSSTTPTGRGVRRRSSIRSHRGGRWSRPRQPLCARGRASPRPSRAACGEGLGEPTSAHGARAEPLRCSSRPNPVVPGERCRRSAPTGCRGTLWIPSSVPSELH
jgi:hypothetical protein